MDAQKYACKKVCLTFFPFPYMVYVPVLVLPYHPLTNFKKTVFQKNITEIYLLMALIFMSVTLLPNSKRRKEQDKYYMARVWLWCKMVKLNSQEKNRAKMEKTCHAKLDVFREIYRFLCDYQTR